MLKKVIGAVVALVLLVGLPSFIYALTNNKLSIGYNKGYMPEQPIPYSHELHAGQLKIDCKYCHTATEVSRHASVPSLNICMNCHLNVNVREEARPHIERLQQAYMNNEPIKWEKVHLLPDHVKFNHAAHVRADKQCQECHGPIEKMPIVYQHSDLSMGWCVNCHRQPENNAPVGCDTCHY